MSLSIQQYMRDIVVCLRQHSKVIETKDSTRLIVLFFVLVLVCVGVCVFGEFCCVFSFHLPSPFFLIGFLSVVHIVIVG